MTSESRVNVLTSVGGMPFDQVWNGRVEAVVDGVPVPFISKGDLIECKSMVGRHIDLADAERLALVPEPDALDLPAEEDGDA